MNLLAPKKEERLWTSSYLSLLIINLLLCFGFYMLPATLPAYVKQIGGSNFQASLVFGMFSSMSLISRVISGSVVEAIGEKVSMLTGMAIVIVCTSAYIWAPVNGILLLRSLQGIGWGMATAAIATAVYKAIPDKKRGEGSGYYALTTIISLSFTPMIAMVIMSSLSFTIVSIVSSSLIFIGIFMLAAGLFSPIPGNSISDSKGRERTIKNLFEKGALLPSTLCFLLSIPLCGIMGYLMLYGQELHMENVWIFFIGYTVMILLTRPFIGRLFDKRGHAVVIIPGSVLMILGLFALSVTHSPAMLVISSLLYGLGYGAVQPSLQTWAVNRCPEDRKGAANGVFLSSIDLGYIVGSIILGYIAGKSSYASMYGYSVAFMIIFLLIYAFSLAKSRSISFTS